jgi:hypothetical protein
MGALQTQRDTAGTDHHREDQIARRIDREDVMAAPLLELEGPWEEILSHAKELEGRRVRVTVLPVGLDDGDRVPLKAANQRMLAALEKWRQIPLTPEEREALDDFEQFQKEHPFDLGPVDLDR